MLRFLRAAWRAVTRTSDGRRFEFFRPALAFGLYHFGDDGEPGRFSLKLFFVYVALWRTSRPLEDEDGILDAWAVDVSPFSDRAIYLQWGGRHKFLELPWSLVYEDTARLNSSGEFVTINGPAYCSRVPDQVPEELFVFRYTTNGGELQETLATVRCVERRRWRWRLCRFLRLPFYRVRYSLDVSFADEMGSERGSWKGGVTGTGCEWKPGETVEAALRRFEREANEKKKFCR